MVINLGLNHLILAISLKIIYVPWSKALEYCYRLAAMILDAGIDVDVIVAISRGGLIPARIVSDILGVDEFITIRSKLWSTGVQIRKEPEISVHEKLEVKGFKTLVVDEVVDTGKTMDRTVKLLSDLGARSVKTAVLHYKSTSIFKPDYYVEKLYEPAWIYYPWSLVETLYGLVKTESGELVENSMNLLRKINATELYLDPVRIGEAVKQYAKREFRIKTKKLGLKFTSKTT